MAGSFAIVRVAIAGAHGKVGRRLARLLVAQGYRVRGLIRDPEQADDLRADGSEPAICDLETAGVGEIAAAIDGANAVVFAAGAGPGSGAERKLTMDRDGAIKLIEAARKTEIARYVMVSSIRAEDPPDGDDVFSVYLRAKAEADRALQASDRSWTIVRPGGLTNDAGDGRVRLDDRPLQGSVSRDDVAALLAKVLPEPRTVGRTLYVVDGDDPLEWELEAVLTRPRATGPQPGVRL
ncbi:MAG: SDR family oxidoreductase [Gaiellaceae bacterium]